MTTPVPDQRVGLTILLAVLALLIAGCAKLPVAHVEPEVGLTHQQVRAALGEPDEREEFMMPQGPLFGPQEKLSGVVPAGGVVEEWRYEHDGQVIYVWFHARRGAGQEVRKVIATATYPKGAVY